MLVIHSIIIYSYSAYADQSFKKYNIDIILFVEESIDITFDRHMIDCILLVFIKVFPQWMPQ